MISITEIKVFLMEQAKQESKLKAYINIVLNDCFVIRGIRVIEGQKGLFISMPSIQKKNGEFQDVAHPINKETRKDLEEKILKAYESKLEEKNLS